MIIGPQISGDTPAQNQKNRIYPLGIVEDVVTEIFLEKFGDFLRYEPPKRIWYFDGKSWQPDVGKTEALKLAAKIPEILSECANQNKKYEDAFRKAAQKYSDINARKRVLNSAKTKLKALHEPEAGKSLLNLLNGTYDLVNDKFREHRREDILTKISMVQYDPNVDCPTWKSFITEALSQDTEAIDFLQKAVGYSITAGIELHKLFAIVGPPGSGKSTFSEVLLSMFGEYAAVIQSGVLFRLSRMHPNAVMPLKGRRLALCAEAESEYILDDATVKRLTGGDTVSARYLREEFQTFKPTWKIWLTMNKNLKISHLSEGIWRRILVIPFNYLPRQIDVNLPQKLAEEKSGILNWILQGLRLFRRDGLNVPRLIQDATNTLRAASDPFWAFLDAKCIQVPNETIGSTPLYNAHAAWRQKHNIEPISQKAFTLGIKEHIGESKKDGEGIMYFAGVALKD